MSETNTISAKTSSGNIKMLRAMVGIGVLCALLIVLTFESTKPRIAQLREEALQQAIFKVLPGAVTTATYRLENDKFILSENATEEGLIIYAGFNENKELVGLVVEAAGQGYAGIIRILYGYSPDSESVIGFHVLESLETPGLGDKIEKDPAFLLNFEALDVSLTNDKSAVKNPVITVKNGTKTDAWEIDGITGATISSRAIGNIIKLSSEEIIPLIYKNQDQFKLD